MIVITGASGQLGRAVVERLLERLPAAELGVSMRDPAKGSELAGRGVRVRQGDYDDPASLRRAFEGATQLLLVSSNSGGADTPRQHQSAIEAARDAGARHIVYTSHMGASADSHFPPMRHHAATEALLEAFGVAFTSLRNGFYASSGLMQLGHALDRDALDGGTVTAPQDGPVSWTAHADLAEAAALILTDEGRFEGVTPPLTGTEALDLADLAAIATELGGREVKRTVISDDEHRANLSARGVPDAAADMMVGLYLASRRGEFAATDPALARLLGRAPTSMRTVIGDVLASRTTTP